MFKKFCGVTIFVAVVFTAASFVAAAERGGGGGAGGGGGGFSGGGASISAGSSARGFSSPSISSGVSAGARSPGNISGNVGASARSFTPNTSAAVRGNVNALTPNVNRSPDLNRSNQFTGGNNFNRNLGSAITGNTLGANNWEHRNGWSNDYGRNWNRDWDRRDGGRDSYYPFAFYPFWYSGGYGYGYPYYSYDYGYDYPTTVIEQPSPDSLAAVDVNSSRASGDSASAGEQFYNQARQAFLSKNYKEAVRLAGHAAVDAPRSEKVHELMSLALFATGDFRSASAEAHAAASLGPVGDWAALRDYYRDTATYKTQLDALKTAARQSDAPADVHFLLGYHYMMQGYFNHAHTQFAMAVALAPKDDIAKHLMDDLSKMKGGLDGQAQTSS